MTRQAKARKHRAHKYGKNTRKPYGTKNRTRDYDQVCEDMKSSEEALKAFTQGDEDEVGGGKWYCVPCARYFIDETVLMRHYKTAPHKKM